MFFFQIIYIIINWDVFFIDTKINLKSGEIVDRSLYAKPIILIDFDEVASISY